MPQRIVSVSSGSLAARSGIREGETLLSISGTPVLDLVDYQFLTARPSLELTMAAMSSLPATQAPSIVRMTSPG